MSRDELGAAVVAVQDYVRYLQRLGVTELPLEVPEPVASVVSDGGRGAASPAAAREALTQLSTSVRDCTQCSLHRGRTQVVFGTGDPSADLVFVGEAPGRDEDLQGEPFVGKSGQLLTRIIEAIGFRRDQVYILNVVKCRPPDNRNPTPDEVAACRPILQAQLDCLKPRVICAMGAFAAQSLLQTDERISRLRGRFHMLGTIQVMPTYHPAYLLRNPQEKRAVWQDMQAVQRVLSNAD